MMGLIMKGFDLTIKFKKKKKTRGSKTMTVYNADDSAPSPKLIFLNSLDSL